MYNIQKKSYIILLLVCVFSLLQFLGCANNKDRVNQKKNVDYDIGVIHSTSDKGTSEIDFIKKNGDLVTTKNYNYGYIMPAGYFNSIQSNDMLYVCPLGRETERTDNIILGIDLNNTNGTAYKFDHANILSFQYANDYICTSSNENGYNNIDQYSIKSKEKKSIQCSNCIIDSIVNCNKYFYAMKMNMDTEKISLCKIDFDNNKCLDIFDLDDSFKEVPHFLVTDNQMLYFTNGKKLYCFDTETEDQHQYELIHENSYNLKIVDNKLYVGCTDICNDSKSILDIYELNTGKLLGSTPINTTIMQMEVKNDLVYLSDLNTVDIYQLNEKYNALKQQSIDMNAEKNDGNNYVCGFFLKKN